MKVLINFDPKWEKEYDVNLAVYAQYPCIVKLATTQQAVALEGRQVNWTGQEDPGENQHTWNNQGAWGY